MLIDILSEACEKGNVELVKLLLIGFDVNTINAVSGKGLLHSACNTSADTAADAVKFLISKGADVNATTTNGFKTTPLHHAASIGKLDVVKLLVENGAKLDSKGILNQTPLYIAEISKHKDVVEYLENQCKKCEIPTPKTSDFSKVLVVVHSTEDKILEGIDKQIPTIFVKIPKEEFFEGKNNYSLSKEIIELFPRKEMIRNIQSLPTIFVLPLSCIVNKNEVYNSHSACFSVNIRSSKNVIEYYHACEF